MGVRGKFWDLLKPYACSEDPDFLRDKRVAVDLSFWIIQHEAAVRSRSPRARFPHLRLAFFRTVTLFSKMGAYPVFVVDGEPSPLKAQARMARFLRGSGVALNPPHLLESCVEECEVTGKLRDLYIPDCQLPDNDASLNNSWYVQEPLYLQWKQLNCRSDCRYHCMMQRENERGALGLSPVKYHGKWPFKHVFVFQEPVSAVVSAINLLMHFIGWLSFFLLVNYKLPLRHQGKKTYYEYTGMWHIYGLLSMNAWFWSAIYHIRDFDLTEKLDCSSAVAALGYSLILSLFRSFNVKDEASRVMLAAPILAFVTTHILYLNFYQLDFGWNMKVCLAMGIFQLVVWVVWAGVTRHPSRFKLWTVMFGTGIALFLGTYDFPPYEGYVDASAMRHAISIPLTYLWWSFIRADAEQRTLNLVKKVKKT